MTLWMLNTVPSAKAPHLSPSSQQGSNNMMLGIAIKFRP